MNLDAQDITVRAGRRILVSAASVKARSGEVLAVLGPNGAGKSTLLGALAGDRRPDAGEVLLGGAPIARMRPAELARRRAVLPQESRVAFPFDAIEVVLLGRFPHHGGIERCRDRLIAARMLEDVGLAHRARQAYGSLSGGERLRVQIARVFAQLEDAHDGGVLLLDEPTASLDMPQAAAVLRMARRAAAGGAAVVAVLHDLNLAARFADRLLLLHEGRVHASGTPRDLLRPSTIAAVWDQPCAVLEHPADGGPLVVPLHARTSRPEAEGFRSARPPQASAAAAC